jgi:hypothetical protein
MGKGDERSRKRYGGFSHLAVKSGNSQSDPEAAIRFRLSVPQKRTHFAEA